MPTSAPSRLDPYTLNVIATALRSFDSAIVDQLVSRWNVETISASEPLSALVQAIIAPTAPSVDQSLNPLLNRMWLDLCEQRGSVEAFKRIVGAELERVRRQLPAGMEAEDIEAMRRDAARYEWLRESFGQILIHHDGRAITRIDQTGKTPFDPATLDRAIDSALDLEDELEQAGSTEKSICCVWRSGCKEPERCKTLGHCCAELTIPYAWFRPVGDGTVEFTTLRTKSLASENDANDLWRPLYLQATPLDTKAITPRFAIGETVKLGERGVGLEVLAIHLIYRLGIGGHVVAEAVHESALIPASPKSATICPLGATTHNVMIESRGECPGCAK